MKSFIIAALLFSVSASAQDRFYYSQTEYDYLMKVQNKAIWTLVDRKPNMPMSVDGMLYTRCISEDGHDKAYDQWIKKYPDGYEVYCDPCEIKINDYEAVEQSLFAPNSIGTVISMPYWLADTIVTKIDTVKCVMLVSELGSPAKHQNGYGVKKGWSHLKYLDANKAEVKGFVWLSQEFDWQNPDK